MRAPAFLAVWLVTFAVIASGAALGGALLLDRDLRRERAAAGAEGELAAFLESKVAEQAQGSEALTIMKGLAGQAGDHREGADLAADVARFRSEPGAGSATGRVFLYRRGQTVSGAAAWPAAIQPFRRGLVRYQAGPDGDEVIAALHRFPNGDQLLVGRHVEPVNLVSGRILRVSGLTILGLALAGGAVAWLFAVGYNRRLRAITDACERVEAGEMDARAPAADRTDEFGLLARRVNHMLDRVGRYVEGMRDVSDEIAHDLRTPLNRIQARLGALRKDLTPAAAADLDLAAEDLRNLSRTIDDFLWLREVEAGHGGQTAFFDLRALADEVSEDHALIAEDDRGVSLTVHGDPVEIMGVRSLLVRAIDNIVANAVKFTPAGGAIRVCTAREAGHALVVVEDTGPGMPADLLGRATQPGVRGGHDQPGHGLGLAIAASVARRHGGELSLENLAAGGFRASLRLPLPPA
ncbi:MAG: HAMP domain-containing histidine kinase [Caulobacter sp.]|nr:HAMP domain-containing histidine kinase [Caulobacter sp.]